MPASQALLPTLVAEAHFPSAVAWSSSWFRAATIFGPVVGGLVYGAANSPLPVYGFAAAAYIAAMFLYSRIHVNTAPRQLKSPEMLWEGLRYVWQNKFILGATSLDLFAVLRGGAVALLPAYARDILQVGAWGLGILRCAPGVGAIGVALLLAHHPLGRRQGTIMLWCVFGFGVATIVFGL